MSVTRDEVRAVAALARLHLTEEEASLFAAQLADILAHVEELDAAGSTDAVEPPGLARAPLRIDEPPADELAQPPSAIAPEWREGFFTVPRLDAMSPGSSAGAEPA